MLKFYYNLFHYSVLNSIAEMEKSKTTTITLLLHLNIINSNKQFCNKLICIDYKKW